MHFSSQAIGVPILTWCQGICPWYYTYRRNSDEKELQKTTDKGDLGDFSDLLNLCWHRFSRRCHWGAGKKKLGVGNYLADGKGMTLYTFSKDKSGKSACTGECLTQWPVFYVNPELVVEGCEQSDFGSFTRDDGAEQITYKGNPLYYYVKDEKPGQTNGHEAAKGWTAAKK